MAKKRLCHLVLHTQCMALVGMKLCGQEARRWGLNAVGGGLCEDHLNVLNPQEELIFDLKEAILMYWTLKELGFYKDICRYIILQHWAPLAPPVTPEDWDPCYRGHYYCNYRFGPQRGSVFANECPCDKMDLGKKYLLHGRHNAAVAHFSTILFREREGFYIE